MQELAKYCDGALEAVNISSEMIKNNFANTHQIQHKGIVDLVTEVDIASEKILREIKPYLRGSLRLVLSDIPDVEEEKI